MKKKIVVRVLIGLIIILVIASVIAYFVLRTERPWMAFFFACCGGVLVLNILLTLYLVNKNFRNPSDKR
jgi:zinc transporter ZupT